MSWSNPPSRHKKQVRVDSDKMAKRVAIRVLRNVIFSSPVDTGRFRGNWRVGISRPTARALPGRDVGGNSTFQQGTAKIKKAGRNLVIFISNNLPYARRLNEGWSRQAPANFVEGAIKRAQK